MTAHKLSLADEAVITDLLAKNSRLEEEIEYLHNELVSMRTGPQSKLLEENRNLRHELAVLVHGVDVESERLRGQLATVTAERDELVASAQNLLDSVNASIVTWDATERLRNALAKISADKTGEQK